MRSCFVVFLPVFPVYCDLCQIHFLGGFSVCTCLLCPSVSIVAFLSPGASHFLTCWCRYLHRIKPWRFLLFGLTLSLCITLCGVSCCASTAVMSGLEFCRQSEFRWELIRCQWSYCWVEQMCSSTCTSGAVLKCVYCFLPFPSLLCVSLLLFIPFFRSLLSPLHDAGCGFANQELSPIPYPLGDPLSTPSALFPVVIAWFLLARPVSVPFPLFSASFTISSCFYLMMDVASSASGFWGARVLVMPEDPEDSGPSQTFPARCSLNSSWETNEDEFGGWMCFCIRGVPASSHRVHLFIITLGELTLCFSLLYWSHSCLFLI